MMKPRLLLFDLGNVLVQFLPERFARTLRLDSLDVRNTYEGPARDITNQFERGNYTIDEYFGRLGELFNGRFDVGKLKEAFGSVLTDPVPGMEEIVRKTVQAVPCAVVSNTNDYHFNDVLPRVPALTYLPKRYLSYQIRAIKPSPEFYQYVIRNEKVSPGEMLFIDDVRANIEAAERFGMAGFQFRNAGELKQYLTKLGVI